jgi:predicted O-methyltransferase YrrM
VETVVGDVIEFGSYEGHSGLLIAEYFRRRGITKRIRLLDVFDRFPAEDLGVDGIWAGTHPVDFAAVTRRFTTYDNVELIAGDFTSTATALPAADRYAFALIDCDSFRGTAFALEWLLPRLSPGAVVMCEDYGHHHLLGARMAVDEFLAVHGSAFTSFFSFFGGSQILVRR